MGVPPLFRLGVYITQTSGMTVRSAHLHNLYQVLGKTVINQNPYHIKLTRTKNGFSSGTHYSEITPHNCQFSCYHAYVGVSTVNVDFTWFLGKEETGWGLKGYNGELYHKNNIIKYSNTFLDENDVYGLLDLRPL